MIYLYIDLRVDNIELATNDLPNFQSAPEFNFSLFSSTIEPPPVHQDLRRDGRERVKRKIKLPGEITTEIESDDDEPSGSKKTPVETRPIPKKCPKVVLTRTKHSSENMSKKLVPNQQAV